ncbi:MAG TPA: histidine phosphatase family protein [Thermoanaerobaculia bacterium]|nr:histidine phosphatase family protein [Thermoanaerobaculia bacterium]
MLEQLILVRHGETVHNAAGIAQGWNDSALSEVGIAQVRSLARRLRNSGANALYSSPLGRALSTAQYIAEEVGLEVTTLDELREMSYGSWEGRSFLDVRSEDEAAYQRWIGDPDAQCPSGESHNDVLRRMQRAFATIERGPSNAIVVTHGTAIRIGATVLLGAPVTAARHLAQDNASLNLFVRRGERLVLKVWNDTTHCSDSGAPL